MRAQKQLSEFDQSAAMRKFDRSPFAWAETDTQLWNTTLVACWSWQTRGVEREAFTTVRLDSLRNSGLPSPTDIGDMDYKLWRDLELVAANESMDRKAPCKYLGQLSARGRFEPDPSKWNVSESSEGRKSHAKVHFEWQHVFQGRAPFRVVCRANDLLANGRRVPRNPLGQNSFTGLTATLDFLKAVALNTHPGVLFQGIVLEAERADIKKQLPNDGVDVFGEPVYWIR